MLSSLDLPLWFQKFMHDPDLVEGALLRQLPQNAQLLRILDLLWEHPDRPEKGTMFGLGLTNSTCIDQLQLAGLSFPHFQEYHYQNLSIQFKVTETHLIGLWLIALPAVPCPRICRLLCQKLWDLTMAGDWNESVRRYVVTGATR